MGQLDRSQKLLGHLSGVILLQPENALIRLNPDTAESLDISTDDHMLKKHLVEYVLHFVATRWHNYLMKQLKHIPSRLFGITLPITKKRNFSYSRKYIFYSTVFILKFLTSCLRFLWSKCNFADH